MFLFINTFKSLIARLSSKCLKLVINSRFRCCLKKIILFTVSICLLHFNTEQEELFPASEYFVSFVFTMREKK